MGWLKGFLRPLSHQLFFLAHKSGSWTRVNTWHPATTMGPAGTLRPKLVAQGQALPQALGTGLHGGLQGPNRAFTVLGVLMNSCRLLCYSGNSMNLYAREKSWFLELSAKSPLCWVGKAGILAAIKNNIGFRKQKFKKKYKDTGCWVLAQGFQKGWVMF